MTFPQRSRGSGDRQAAVETVESDGGGAGQNGHVEIVWIGGGKPVRAPTHALGERDGNTRCTIVRMWMAPSCVASLDRRRTTRRMLTRALFPRYGASSRPWLALYIDSNGTLGGITT
jgi:hypothetical protein